MSIIGGGDVADPTPVEARKLAVALLIAADDAGEQARQRAERNAFKVGCDYERGQLVREGRA